MNAGKKEKEDRNKEDDREGRKEEEENKKEEKDELKNGQEQEEIEEIEKNNIEYSTTATECESDSIESVIDQESLRIKEQNLKEIFEKTFPEVYFKNEAEKNEHQEAAPEFVEINQNLKSPDIMERHKAQKIMSKAYRELLRDLNKVSVDCEAGTSGIEIVGEIQSETLDAMEVLQERVKIIVEQIADNGSTNNTSEELSSTNDINKNQLESSSCESFTDNSDDSERDNFPSSIPPKENDLLKNQILHVKLLKQKIDDEGIIWLCKILNMPLPMELLKTLFKDKSIDLNVVAEDGDTSKKFIYQLTVGDMVVHVQCTSADQGHQIAAQRALLQLDPENALYGNLLINYYQQCDPEEAGFIMYLMDC